MNNDTFYFVISTTGIDCMTWLVLSERLKAKYYGPKVEVLSYFTDSSDLDHQRLYRSTSAGGNYLGRT